LGSTIGQFNSPDLPPEETTPAEIGGYRLLRLIGAGGMGRVFEAESLATGQKVAVKLLSSRLTNSPVSVERFRQEGRLASQIAHPRCVFVLAADTEHNRPYIVMELMKGETLRDLLERRGTIPPQEAIALVLDVIEGLLEAHQLGVIHRDIKPSNCFLMPDGHVKIGDFGLSKSLGGNGQLTQSGAFLGTVLYASPEQIRGESVDYSSDVYSLSATLYELLTGRPPFLHENVTAALARIISEDPPPVRSVNPNIPRSLARVVEKGLERDRSRRWEDMEEFRDALVALMPSRLSFGGLTIRIGAYLLDEVFVRLLLILPLTGLIKGFVGEAPSAKYLSLFVFPIYFVILEGLFGASIGKRLLRLRVCRVGSTDPPGLKLAIVRTLAFYLLITLTLVPLRVAFEHSGVGLPVLLSILPFIAGLVVLIAPMRRSNHFRGMHEALSGTCVLKLPPKRRAIKLSARRPNPVRSLLPRPEMVPTTIGPYSVKGAILTVEGNWILRGEDAVLSRGILIRLLPRSQVARQKDRDKLIRPTRLRFIHHGEIEIQGADWIWEAYVEPNAAPLWELVRSGRQLSWRETRYLLEQLSNELANGQKDGTMPPSLSLEQVWIQSDGRLQLLDFPIPRPTEALSQPTINPLQLLRDVATVALEGEPRPAGKESEPIHAAIPLHARNLLQRLLNASYPFTGVEAFQLALKESHYLPTEVDPSLRLGQLTVQAANLSIGLVIMFGIGALFAVFNILARETNIYHAQQIIGMLETPEGQEELAADAPFARALSANPLEVHERLQSYIDQQHSEIDRMTPALSTLEAWLLREWNTAPKTSNPAEIRGTLEDALQPDEEALHQEPFAGWREACLVILLCPIAWSLGSFLLRGGISYWVLGIAVMRPDGRKASHRRCGARALLVWLPVALMLCLAVMIQAKMPRLVVVHSVFWLTALALLPIYFALALTQSDRGIHDRILGTRLVPK
jgi:uncharacterized RDD family membrane protein YckC